MLKFLHLKKKKKKKAISSHRNFTNLSYSELKKFYDVFNKSGQNEKKEKNEKKRSHSYVTFQSFLFSAPTHNLTT